MKPFESYYANNDFMMKSRAKKYYNACKLAAIEMLQAENKHAKGRDKIIGKRYISILKENL